MQSRMLGIVALTAIGVAAVSFGVVDVTIASGCGGGLCTAGIPLFAIVFSVLGGLATAVAVVPAIGWVIESVREASHHDEERDRELARAVRSRRVYVDDDL